MDSSTKAKKREEFLAVVRKIGPLGTSALAAGESPRQEEGQPWITRAQKEALKAALAALHEEARRHGKNVHVLPRQDGGWEVKVEGGLSALVDAATQQQALKAARTVIETALEARNEGCVLPRRDGGLDVKVEGSLSALVFGL